MKHPLVTTLDAYPWSSYRSFIGKTKPPQWLDRETTYSLLGYKQRFKGYMNYVMQGTDKEIAEFYQKGNLAGVMGDKDFRRWVYEELLPELEMEEKGRVILPDISMADITKVIAMHYKASAEGIRKVTRGPQKGNEARKLSMYLCQELLGEKHKDIANYFNLGYPGSVSYIIHQVRKMKLESGVFKRKNRWFD